jgi:uncharacterized membrane protein
MATEALTQPETKACTFTRRLFWLSLPLGAIVFMIGVVLGRRFGSKARALRRLDKRHAGGAINEDQYQRVRTALKMRSRPFSGHRRARRQLRRRYARGEVDEAQYEAALRELQV